MIRKQILALLALLLSFCLLTGQALPPELEKAAPEAAGKITGDAEDGFGLFSGLRELLGASLEKLKDHLLSGVKSIAAIMAGTVLLGVVESAAPAGKDTIGKYVSIAGALWITAVSAGDLNALIGMGEQTILDLSLLSKTLLPALAAAEAASGGMAAAAVKEAAAVFFADALLTSIEKLLLPMVHLYIGTAVAGAVLEGDAMARTGELLKKAISWALSGMLILFTGYLAISGAVAGAADAQAVKVAKAAVSTAVPVVGGILSEAVGSVLAGAGILKGMVGSFGTLAVLGCCLVPVLRLGCQYLLYQGASLVAAAAGPEKLTKLLEMLSDAFALVLAMTAASAVAVIISIVSSLTAVVLW